jgi:hypothetical protein
MRKLICLFGKKDKGGRRVKKKNGDIGEQAAVVLLVALCGMLTEVSAFAEQSPKTNTESAVAVGTNTVAVSIDDQLAAIQDAIDDTDDQGKRIVEASHRENVIRTLTHIQQLIENKDFRGALQECANVLSLSPSPSFHKMVKELHDSISLQIKADQTKLAKDMRDILAAIPTACAAATNAADLQSLNERVQQAQNSLARMSDNDNPELYVLRENLQNAHELIRMSVNCLAAESAGDLSKAVESMNQMMSMSSFSSFASSPEMIKKLDRLQSAVAEEAMKVIKAARDGLGKVTTSQDVHALSLDFNRQYSRVQRYSYNDPVIQQDLESTRNALSSWARLLGSEERGDIASALQVLQSMENNYYSRMDSSLEKMLAPKRSALIVKLLNQSIAVDDSIIKVVSDQVATVDSLEKLIELRHRLTPISFFATQRAGYEASQPEIQSFLADIQTLEIWRDSLQVKQYGVILQLQSNPRYYSSYTSAHRWKAIVNRYQNQMRAQALAEMFELKGFEVKEGQTPDQMLLQAADKAAADKQWETVVSYLDAYKVVSFGGQNVPASLTDDINGCRNFIAARNYEKAGDVRRASAAYLAVLGSPSKRAPVEDAFREIARLRKDNPDIFEKAQNISVTVPATIDAP